ncbi:hypothetical protein A0H81_07451 [Grifola frondosa]|uniref:Uncharacterized protein n=1 Tax=Grifola frondosa TaxID=5627 RepID=A0A1C7MCB1_GRIFR|nr:hypothetical protein A0H81_07451 [Grifola frondosa]
MPECHSLNLCLFRFKPAGSSSPPLRTSIKKNTAPSPIISVANLVCGSLVPPTQVRPAHVLLSSAKPV